MCKIKVLADSVSRFPFWLADDWLLHSHMVFPQWIHMEKEGELSEVSSYKDTNPIRSGFRSYNLFNFNYFLEALSPNTITLQVRASTYGFLGDNSVHSIHSTLFILYPLLGTIFPSSLCLVNWVWFHNSQLRHHFLQKVFPAPLRQLIRFLLGPPSAFCTYSIVAYITLCCNCLFIHLFSSLDCKCLKVWSSVLFIVAVSAPRTVLDTRTSHSDHICWIN